MGARERASAAVAGGDCAARPLALASEPQSSERCSTCGVRATGGGPARGDDRGYQSRESRREKRGEERSRRGRVSAHGCGRRHDRRPVVKKVRADERFDGHED